MKINNWAKWIQDKVKRKEVVKKAKTFKQCGFRRRRRRRI